MVAKIYTGETPTQELQRQFREELQGKMEEAALKLGCGVEELKYRFANDGVVEIERMTPEEMIELTAQEQQQKRIIQVKKDRGVQ